MTGKEIVLFILDNDLLDIEITKDTLKDRFWTVEEAAINYGIGTASLTDMIKLGIVKYVTVNDIIYIPKNSKLNIIPNKVYR